MTSKPTSTSPALDTARLERLQRALAESGLVSLAILFGSRASGNPRPDSDFDVGVIPKGTDLSLRQELALAATLSRAVEAEVDLVRLDADNPLLGREVAQRGVCLLEAEPGAFAAYRASAMLRWLDFEEVSAPHRDAFLRRLANT